MLSTHDNLHRVFQHGFTAQDIAQPLISCDAVTPAELVKVVMEQKGHAIAGVRTEGVISGVVAIGDLATGPCGAFACHIDEAEIVADMMPLAALILRLAKHPRLFVVSLGQIGGVVDRFDLLQPAARMWLFGMVTLIEMRFSRIIQLHCPGDSWRPYLSDGRIQKAAELLQERSRRNQQLTLADCLQFSDKTQIIARNSQLRKLTSFESRRQLVDVGKRLEKLRNNLAHSQDIVTNDWETIVALAENLDDVLEGPPGLRSDQG